MKDYQNPILFNTILFNPIINNNLSYINLNPPRIIGNDESKPFLTNDINKMNSIYKNSFINFPFLSNINNKDIFKNHKQNTILNQLENDNYNYNLNLLNKINKINNNNLFTGFNFTSLFNNNNLFNVNNFNNNLLFNKNNPCISQLFEKNIFFKKNDLLNSKPLQTFNNDNNNINDKIDLITNDINNSFDDINDEYFTIFSKKKEIKENSPLKKCTTLKFQINCKRKRGRRGTDLKDITKPKRIHTSTDFDNILRKVQVHFLTFIVHFINDILDVVYPYDKKRRFLNMGYGMKKIVNHNHIQYLKNKKIGEILQFKPSPKYKSYSNENINRENYIKICEDNNFLKNIFDLNYLDFFNQYYYNAKRNILIYGKQITFKRAKFFCDLLQRNKTAASKIEEVVKSHYNIKTGKIFVVDKIDNT